ncbi:DNA translocase FtsK [Vandammella animalimorsus]|uniref:Cell division protein FtsK n=1 Tax=Vandammella animalimorsus TaxID=2029117 RepID=A0A2A2ALR8_9BURK|nr:DNA translocase FtsK [Vandammella animalimorsus]PAT38776.1 cell division protein FtsK [Vandammella animalimorsus]
MSSRSRSRSRSSGNTFNSSPQEAGPGFLSRFGQDVLLFIALVVGSAWVAALLSYSPQDPAWSSSGQGAAAQVPHNWLGSLGAYWSDVSYFLLGYTVWVLVAALALLWWWAFRAWLSGKSQVRSDGRLMMLRIWGKRLFWLGSVLLLLCACAVLEWTRLYRFEGQLPDHSGGVLGYWVGPLAVRWLGYTGSTVAALVLALLTLSWVLGFSWGKVAERTGAWIERWIDRVRLGHEHLRDARAGRRAQREREEQISKEAVLTRDALSDALPEHLADIPEEQLPQLQELPEAALPKAGAAPGSAAGEAGAESAAPPPAYSETVDLPWDEEPAPGKSYATTRPQERIEPLWDDPSPAAANETALISTPVKRQKHLFDDARSGALPSVALLDPIAAKQETVTPETLEMTSRLIEKKLKDFGVEVRVVEAQPGPVVTRYEIEPATGVKGAQIVNLSKDLARSLSLMSIRVIETIPGKNYMALELPNARRQSIQLKEILSSDVYQDEKSKLALGLGKDIIGKPIVADLAKMPHCLVAGTTGSGKSVGINAMILSLLFKAEPSEVRLLMIDPKMLEMSVYEGIPHLLCPVVTDMKQAAHGLNWCVAEMERRYKLMSKLGVRNLAGYNAKIKAAQDAGEIIGNPFSLTPEDPEPLDALPHIVIIIDELADLMMVVGKKIEELIARLAQKARAAGIHLILATQRPSVDVITGLIKANVPTRIAFQVSSKIDSRTILDQMGAEALLGMGDMLYMKGGTGLPVRVHGAFVSDDEVHRVVEFIKQSMGEAEYIDGVLEGVGSESESDWAVDFEGTPAGAGGGEKDPMYDQAVEIVLKDRKSSISHVQRKLRIGYNRAARILEDMESAGLVGALGRNGQRDILVPHRGE